MGESTVQTQWWEGVGLQDGYHVASGGLFPFTQFFTIEKIIQTAIPVFAIIVYTPSQITSYLLLMGGRRELSRALLTD